MSQVDKIRELHRVVLPGEPGLESYCWTDWKPWPCDTAVVLAELDEALASRKTFLQQSQEKNDEIDRLGRNLAYQQGENGRLRADLQVARNTIALAANAYIGTAGPLRQADEARVREIAGELILKHWRQDFHGYGADDIRRIADQKAQP